MEEEAREEEAEEARYNLYYMKEEGWKGERWRRQRRKRGGGSN